MSDRSKVSAIAIKPALTEYATNIPITNSILLKTDHALSVIAAHIAIINVKKIINPSLSLELIVGSLAVIKSAVQEKYLHQEILMLVVSALPNHTFKIRQRAKTLYRSQ